MEPPQEVSSNFSKNKKQSGKHKASDATKNNGAKTAATTTTNKASSKSNKSLVDELKLFENSALLNQQDPLQQLQLQINQLIKDDDCGNFKRGPLEPVATTAVTNHSNSEICSASGSKGQDNATKCNNQLSLSSPSMQIQQTTAINNPNCHMTMYDSVQNIFTIKKGVLWQQQNYEKFHQRLFSRWKKRYFILTTDYLVCFKRSSTKVGHSEMGKFLYKTSLSDVTKIDWLRPKKSDKGAIIIYLREQFNLFLWSKKGLDEWMILIGESIERLKLRRCGQSNSVNGCNMKIVPSIQVPSAGLNEGFYDNAIVSKSFDDTLDHRNMACNNLAAAIREGVIVGEDHSAKGSTLNSNAHKEEIKAPSCSSSSSRKPLNTLVEMPGSVASSAHSNLIEHKVQDKDKSVKDIDGATVHKDGNYDEQNHQPQMINENRSAQNGNRISQAYNGDEAEQPSENPKSQHFSDNRQSQTVANTKWSDNTNDNAESSVNQGFCTSDNGSTTYTRGASISLNNKNENLPNYNAPDQASPDTPNPASRDREPALSQRVEGLKVDKLERPMGNLIRRDDSWQSLVSLTQVGRNSMQVAHKQSLYVRHKMPALNDGVGDEIRNGVQSQRQHSINIESTVTPLRARVPLRQNVQSYSPRLPPIRQLHANSFDAQQIPSSPSFQGNQQTASYHRKLLQLQLLHNSNNVDYIRGNNHENGNKNDCQIYGPESTTTTNHYGYYSMRSNLKSAASEFSFIRPSSSNFQPQAHQLANSIANQNSSYVLGEHSKQPLVLPEKDTIVDYNNNISAQRVPQGMVSGAQFLVNANGSERFQQIDNQVMRRQQASNHLTLAELTAPNRELPLKPNRKRPVNNCALPESNSLGSSIKCFFRRAFSRRSKRRPKMVESCSSSLAAFDNNFENIQIAQSAFSTGSKSANADRAPMNQPVQSQRMIDLIEAFANKTAMEETNRTIVMQTENPQNQQFNQIRVDRPRINQNQIGSPLHKSNSISTSTGFSGLNELVHRNHNQRLTHGDGVSNFAREQMSSPMALRSTKVMSANLTPLFSRREAFEHPQENVMSPRNSSNLKHLPRPSSIYGQPSLISSPVSSASNKENFGLHRSSLHGNNRDRIPSLNMDFRRQQAIKVSCLDSTKEVAEDTLSPNVESKDFIVSNADVKLNDLNSSLSTRIEASQHQRQAVVNPILQSPTMNAIYDNHPIAINNHIDEVTYSHYDNHRPINYCGQTSETPGYAQPMIINAASRKYYDSTSEATISSADQAALLTSSREIESLRQIHPDRASSDSNRVYVRSKPAAIVAPTTPNHVEYNRNQSKCSTGISDGQYDDASIRSGMRFVGQSSPMRSQHSSNVVAKSPIASRRYLNQQPNYQQSPLVNGQTRILKRGDGVQTTIIGCDQANGGEAVVNIVGAPGVNLDPALAASLLRGTNIDAFQSSTANRLSYTNHSSSNRKTFLVSSRLSQVTTKEAMTNERSSVPAAILEPNTKAQARDTLSRDNGLSSTSSRDSNGITSSSSKVATVAASGNGLDARKDVSTSNFGLSNGTKDVSEGSGDSRATSQTSSGKRRGSSTDQSDEMSSQTGSIDEPDERNWINSKLVQ